MTPKEFEIGSLSTGSRTMDWGIDLNISVVNQEVVVTSSFSEVNCNDLFSNGYYPKETVWHAESTSFDEIVSELAEFRGLDKQLVTEIIVDAFKENFGTGIDEYFKKARGSHEESQDSDSFIITAFPCPVTQYDTDALEVDFDESGWSFTLLCDGDDVDEVFNPETWTGDTLESVYNQNDCPLSSYIGFEALSELLTEHDPVWALYTLDPVEE